MKAIFILFLQICLFRVGPEAVPTRGWFVVGIIALNVVASVLLPLLNTSLPLTAIAASVVVYHATIAAVVLLAVLLREMPRRFEATITAIFGCDLLLTALNAALYPLLQVWGALNVAAYVVLFWSIGINGFILHRAISVHIGIGIALSFLFTLMALSMSQSVVQL